MAAEEGKEMMKPMMRALDELRTRMDKLTVMVEKQRGEVEEFTRTNPMPALGIAFLVGLAAGAIITAASSK